MTQLIRFLRNMSVILFLAFFGYAAIFIILMSAAYNFNWNQLFSDAQDERLKVNTYFLMDDMRREEIITGPFSMNQNAWLNRRSTLYGFLLRYESADKGKSPWFDTLSRVDENTVSTRMEFPFVTDGQIQGYLTVANVSRELDPVNVYFHDTMKSRSLMVLVTVMLFSLVISLILAKKLTVHLTRLIHSASEIRLGKRDVALSLKGPEEIRKLALTLRELSQDLKNQEDWRHNLMADLTHELRTPLTSILSQIEAIIDGVYEKDEERLHDIYEELIRLSRLLNDMERLSDAEGARFNLNIRRDDMVQLTKRVFQNFEPMARDKGIKMGFELPNVPCYAEVDRDKMIQVISNVVSNAIKYTLPGGKIVLGVSWSASNTIIYCQDTGLGISEHDLPYIFNRLYRADKSRSRFSGGVGLGLSIAQALVSAHEGEIEVESIEGKGSTFRVSIPNRYKHDDSSPHSIEDISSVV